MKVTQHAANPGKGDLHADTPTPPVPSWSLPGWQAVVGELSRNSVMLLSQESLVPGRCGGILDLHYQSLSLFTTHLCSSAGKGIELGFLGVEDGPKLAVKLWVGDEKAEERSHCVHAVTLFIAVLSGEDTVQMPKCID